MGDKEHNRISENDIWNGFMKIEKLNESFLKISGDFDCYGSISKFFTFHAPNYRFDPKYRSGNWDGKIRLLRIEKDYAILHVGLLKRLLEFCDKYELKYEVDKELRKESDFNSESIFQFLDTIELPETYSNIHGHQEDLFHIAVLKKRAITISPTGSGKSLGIYLYIKFLQKKLLKPEEKVLLIVPTTSLVLQMEKDFIEYDDCYKEIEGQIHIIFQGHEKTSDRQIFISTWQSLQDQEKEYFKQFRVLIVDECHGAKAKTITSISGACVNADYRLGTTGTLDDWKVHHVMLTGIFGNIYRIVHTKHLIEKGILSKLQVYSIVMRYPLEVKVYVRNFNYKQEIDFVVSNLYRNTLLVNAMSKVEGNTLILFNLIDHGKWIYYEMQKKVYGKKKVFYIDGMTKTEEREEVRADVERNNRNIIVASAAIFSTGINIKRLHNIVLPTGKSKIRVLQSIGRGLRRHETKEHLNVFDFVDDFRLEYLEVIDYPDIKPRINFLYKHYLQRQEYYVEEGFPLQEKIINISERRDDDHN